MILCIDTATPEAGLALIETAQETRALEYRPFGHDRMSESLLGALDDMLTGQGKTLKDLTGILAVSGPGSFTSLRVGIAIANTLAHEMKLPLQGVRTDQFYAARTNKKDFYTLQSMNPEEVVAVGHGTLADQKPPLRKMSEMAEKPAAEWLGTLRPEHRERLKSWNEITALHPPEKAWEKLADAFLKSAQAHVPYALLEPYYGKEPTITKSQRR